MIEDEAIEANKTNNEVQNFDQIEDTTKKKDEDLF